MTEEIIIDVNECPHKSDDDCMEVPICNEYGDLMGYQSCEAQTLCPYRSQKKIERLEQEKNKYYQQTLDDEITISDLIEEIQELKADRTLERISKLSIENARLEQENENLKKEVKQIGSDFIKKGDYARELEQENKELQEEIQFHNKENSNLLAERNAAQIGYDEIREVRERYCSAMEEIRGLLSPHCTQCSQVLDIINEVLGDET